MDVAEQYDKIYRYCYFRLSNKQLAEDITQETFLRFFGQDINLDNDKKLPYLYKIANKKIYQLSGGEQQRIAIIKLILQGSKIILADEPTSGLDEDNEAIVMGLLKKLNEAGVTIIMVTHNMHLCDSFSRVINVENYR